MSSTYSTFAKLEKHEDRSIGWQLGTNFDTIDQGINVCVLTNGQGSDIRSHQPVRFNTSALGFKGAILAAGSPLADGILLGDTAAGAAGQVLTRGFVENSNWTFTLGDIVYLLSDTLDGGITGAFGLRGTTHCVVGSPDDILFMQPCGIAMSATRVYFDFNRFRPLAPYVVPASSYIATAGAVTASIASVAAGTGFQHILTTTGATDVVYTFVVPPWYRAMPNIASVWGFRIWYKIATGTIDVTAVYDGTSHTADPGVGTANSTTWASFDVNWDKFFAVSGWAPTPGKQILVKVACSAGSAVLEVAPRLRFEPLPTMLS